MGSRGPECSVCSHRERAALDLALARGVSMGALERRYGVGNDALYRHRKNHLPAQLRAKLIAGPSLEGVDLDSLREQEGQSLLAHLVALRNRLFAFLDVAEEAGDAGLAARVVGQIHRNLEITGELVGSLSTGSTTINNMLVMPAYVEMRVELVRALAPFPEARTAVAAVLHTMEAGAAAQIAQDASRGLAR